MVEQISSLKTDVRYKDTPIGKVPVDWEVASLGKISHLEYGASLPDRKREKGEVPVYGSSGIAGYHSKALINRPGIIVGRKGTVGSVNWADKNFWPIDTTYYISKKQTKEYLKWLFYFLSNYNFERLNITTGVPGLNREEAHSILVPIPPYLEQRRIAEFLTSVDKAIEQTTRIIEKTKELKKGLMQKLFSEGVRHTGFKDTKIGTIPNEWKVVQLSDILYGNKSKYGIYKEKKLYGTGIQILKIGDVFRKDYYLGEEAKRVTLLEKELISNEVFEKDILIAVASVKQEGIGKVMYVSKLNERTAFDHNVANLRADNNKCNQKFLFFALKSKIVRKQIERLFTTVGTTFLKASEIDKLLMPLPPFDEQHNIAEIFFEIDTNIEKESSHLEQLKLLKKGLMQVLLTGKLRVTV